MAGKDRVSMKDAALLVIDIQNSFSARPLWLRRSTPDFEKNVTRLIAAFREAEQPVIYFLHSDGDPGFEFNGPHYRLMEFLDRRDDEPLLHKTSANAFTSTGLLRMLLQLGVRRLVISGIRTEQCCETTARLASDLGFEVDFVTEATMTFPETENADGSGRVISNEEVIERTEFALRRRFARIATVKEIEDELRVSVPA